MEADFRKNTRFEILTPDGWKNFDGIKRTKRNTGIKIITATGEITVTPEHLIKYKNTFIKAIDYAQTDEVIDCSLINEEQYYYDPINVEDVSSYISNTFVNHNCQFIGSSGTLIAGWRLKEMMGETLRPITFGNGMYQFELPIKGHQYSIICDVSRGRGMDYSTMQIIDVTAMPYKQVCMFRDNMITPLDFAETIYRAAKTYNQAGVLVEINDVGSQVSESLFYDFEYENVVMTQNNGRLGKIISTGFGSKEKDFGIRTTKTVKAIGCAMLKLLVEQHKLLIYDKHTVDELITFSKKNNSYEAEPGNHDDLVMPLVLFSWMTDQQYFKELTDINTLHVLREKTEEQMMEELLPFGFIDDGLDEQVTEQVKEVPSLDAWLHS